MTENRHKEEKGSAYKLKGRRIKTMRKYEKKETGMLTELYCNRCGKKLHVENGIAEGVLPG